MTFIVVVVCAFVVFGLFTISLYNRFIRENNLVKEAWSGIDVQLKRRHDLIPKIIQAISGYLSYEKKTIEDITSLRSRGQGVVPIGERGQIEAGLTSGLKNLFALAENYPDLKANRSFLDLQKAISEIEDQLQMARRYYNGTVRNYNVVIASFPNFILARLLGLHPYDYFQADATERKVPNY